MVLGQYTSTIDNKNRSALPKKFRDELGSTLIITKGLDTQLIIVPVKQWNTLLEGTDGKPFIQRDVRQLQRFLLGNATEFELDTKGRFVLPDYLRDYAQISNEIVYVGVGRFVEVWDKKIWTKSQEEIVEKGMIADIAEKLTGGENE